MPVIKKQKYIENSSISSQNQITTVHTKLQENHEDNKQSDNSSESLLILEKNNINKKFCKNIKSNINNECNTFEESKVIGIQNFNNKSITNKNALNKS